jgi:prephenate dehydrogenase
MSLRFGIIGYGSFGKVLATIIAPHAPVTVSSRRQLTRADLPENTTIGSLEDIASCDVIVLANELARLEEDCLNLAGLISPSAIVMDVCSVKVIPGQIMRNVLGGRCMLLATHPLFGPQSLHGRDNAHGKRIVWHELEGDGFGSLEAFFIDTIGLEVIKMSPEEHDKEMAWVHALTFFIGRGLLDLKMPHLQLSTNYYQQLIKLHDIEKEHSYELFRTIQLGNPYAKEVRDHLVTAFENINRNLDKDNL